MEINMQLACQLHWKECLMLIRLSNNRLSDRVYNFITNLHENIEELNLSKNNLGIASLNEITKLVWSPTSALRNIYLSDCHLSDP